MTKEDLLDLIEPLDKIAYVLSNIPALETEYRNKLSAHEGSEQDLLHELEFINLSRSEKFTLAQRLTEIRRQRRQAKNTLEIISACAKCTRDNSKVVFTLSSLANKLKEIKKIQETRVYAPRTTLR